MKRKIFGFIKRAVPPLLLTAVSGAIIISLTSDEELAIIGKPKPVEEAETGTIYIENNATSNLDPNQLLLQIVKNPEKSVLLVTDTSRLSNGKYTLKGAGNAVIEGYRTTSDTYNADTCIIAAMTPDFTLPDSFSLRTRTDQTLEYKQLSDYAEFTAVYTDVEAERPAMEMYMGYIFVDNGSSIDIYSNTGEYLRTFNDNEFIPAYTRDKSGAPLFYRIETVESGLYDGESIVRDEEETHRVREPHEKDETIILNGKLEGEGEGEAVTEEVKVFYKLSSDGSYFALSDYNDLTDNRGLYFDYPAYYGITDSNISLYAETFENYTQDIDGKVTLEHDAKWSYRRYDSAISDSTYERAFNFSGGLGCVLTEGYYQDGGLFFVNAYGNKAFETIKKYNNTYLDRYIIENYMPPITNGPESIGYYYYDYGLVRARFETIDYWNYVSKNIIRYYSSEEVLLNTEGEQFPIPVGYEIVSYSDGMICLEHNGLYGYMDYTGAWIAEPIYKSASPFSEGLGVLETADGRFGMIDRGGHIVLPFAYSHISSCSDGVILCYSEDAGWEIMRKMTK